MIRRLLLRTAGLVWLLTACHATDPTPAVTPTVATLPPAGTAAALLLPAEAALGDTLTRPGDGMTLRYVPGQHGPASGPGNFWLDETEVSNAQFATFLNSAGSNPAGAQNWLNLAEDGALLALQGTRYLPRPGYEDHPLVQVSWYGAAAYCAWAGGQLPTTAQWQWAARGANEGPFPWGDTVDGSQLNFCDANCPILPGREADLDDGFARTAPVGSYPAGASWAGALDMAGNVWEWVADGSDPGREMLGGSWASPLRQSTITSLETRPPEQQYPFVGFRCLLPP